MSSAIGIQFGSSCYRLSYLSSEFRTPVLLQDAFGNEATSAYFAMDGNTPLYGDDAEKYANISPENCVRGIVKYRSQNGMTEAAYRCEQNALHQTLNYLTDGANTVLETPNTVSSVAVSVANAYLPNTHTNIKDVLHHKMKKQCDAPRIVVVPKTLSAFVGYVMHREEYDDGTYAVLVIGASVAELAFFEIVSANAQKLGNILTYELGGDDFDGAIFDHCCAEFNKLHHVKCKESPSALQRLRVECQKAKDKLSAAKTVVIGIARFIGDRKLHLQVKRSVIEEAMEQKTRDFYAWLDENTAAVKPSLKSVISVGGASRIPLLQSEIKRLFPGLVNSSFNSYAHLAVSYGVAYLADYVSQVDNDLVDKLEEGSVDLEIMKTLKIKMDPGQHRNPESDGTAFSLHYPETPATDEQNIGADTQRTSFGFCEDHHPTVGDFASPVQATNHMSITEENTWDNQTVGNTRQIGENGPESKSSTEESRPPMLNHIDPLAPEGDGAARNDYSQPSEDEPSESGGLLHDVGNEQTQNAQNIRDDTQDQSGANVKESTVDELAQVLGNLSIDDDSKAEHAREPKASVAARPTDAVQGSTDKNSGSRIASNTPEHTENGAHRGVSDTFAQPDHWALETTFSDAPVCRHWCHIENSSTHRSVAEVGISYTAGIAVYNEPGKRVRGIALEPVNEEQRPVFLLPHQISKVQRGDEDADAVVQFRQADRRNIMRLDDYDIFLTIRFGAAEDREEFLCAVQTMKHS